MEKIKVGDYVMSKKELKTRKVYKVIRLEIKYEYPVIIFEHKGIEIPQDITMYRLATTKEIKESKIKSLFKL